MGVQDWALVSFDLEASGFVNFVSLVVGAFQGRLDEH